MERLAALGGAPEGDLVGVLEVAAGGEPGARRVSLTPVGSSCWRMAVSRWIEHRTGWTIKKFVRTARRYRVIEIQVGDHTITAADPLPADLQDALTKIHNVQGCALV